MRNNGIEINSDSIIGLVEQYYQLQNSHIAISIIVFMLFIMALLCWKTKNNWIAMFNAIIVVGSFGLVVYTNNYFDEELNDKFNQINNVVTSNKLLQVDSKNCGDDNSKNIFNSKNILFKKRHSKKDNEFVCINMQMARILATVEERQFKRYVYDKTNVKYNKNQMLNLIKHDNRYDVFYSNANQDKLNSNSLVISNAGVVSGSDVLERVNKINRLSALAMNSDKATLVHVYEFIKELGYNKKDEIGDHFIYSEGDDYFLVFTYKKQFNMSVIYSNTNKDDVIITDVNNEKVVIKKLFYSDFENVNILNDYVADLDEAAKTRALSFSRKLYELNSQPQEAVKQEDILDIEMLVDSSFERIKDGIRNSDNKENKYDFLIAKQIFEQNLPLIYKNKKTNFEDIAYYLSVNNDNQPYMFKDRTKKILQQSSGFNNKNIVIEMRFKTYDYLLSESFKSLIFDVKNTRDNFVFNTNNNEFLIANIYVYKDYIIMFVDNRFKINSHSHEMMLSSDSNDTKDFYIFKIDEFKKILKNN